MLQLLDRGLGRGPDRKVKVVNPVVGIDLVNRMGSWLELARLGERVLDAWNCRQVACCRALYHLSWYVWVWHYDWKVDDLGA